MKTKRSNIKTLIITLLVIGITRAIPALPWWSFTISVAITAMVIKSRNWQVSFFGVGFLAGFILWAGATFYFDAIQPGYILDDVGKLLLLPKVAVMLISGIIGGLVTGLAFYTGKSIISDEEAIPQEHANNKHTIEKEAAIVE